MQRERWLKGAEQGGSRRAGAVALTALLVATLAGAVGVMGPKAAVAAEDTGAVSSGEAFAKAIESAHGAEAWRGHEAVRSDLVVHFGGRRVIDGSMRFDTPLGRARLDLNDGTTVVFDGQDAWLHPADPEFGKPRFHVLTWPYFLAAPMKLRDPGANLEPLGTMTLHGQTYDTAKLTFDPGTGDAPDDWYIVYRDPETHRLAAMAYIVTYDTPRDEAEQDPHAVVYDDFTNVNGVSVPMTWRFYNWNEAQGVHGEPIGEVTLSNVEFIEATAGMFEAPDEAKRVGLPASP